MDEKRRDTILIVDDEEAYRLSISMLLMDRYDVVAVASAEEALARFEHHLPNLILLDIGLPGIDGLQMMQLLRSRDRTKQLPVILISAFTETWRIVEAFELGATDYITKPFNVPVLLARIEAHLRESVLRRKLEYQNHLLAKLAAFDDLTGILNRRSMMDALESEVTRSDRYGHALTLLLIDIDHFKEVNDQHGHLAGDEVLRQFTGRITQALRTSDILCRYGGEEFCIIMPETDHEHAINAAERMRSIVEGDSFIVEGASIHITISVGVACLPDDFEGKAEQMLQDADHALFEAKRTGRNRVRVFAGGDCRVSE